jgi:hypothetical protein
LRLDEQPHIDAGEPKQIRIEPIGICLVRTPRTV